MLVPFAEWRPDVAMLNSKYAADVENVLCAAGSYIPFRSMGSGAGAALADVPIAAFTARPINSSIHHMFAGSATKLYQNDGGGVWVDVTKTATTYAASKSTARWSFAQFGNYVIAVNPNDNPQVFQLGVSTRFTDLAGSPPKAKAVRVWGDFLVLLGLTSHPNRVHWSGLNDIEQWTPGTANSDYQDFPDGGVVQGSNDATNPTIILERAIWSGTFVPGSTEIFTFRKIHENRGAKAPYSIASRGNLTFFLDESGSFAVASDGSLRQIGLEKVDRSIFSVPDGGITKEQLVGAAGLVDTTFSRVYWAVDRGVNSRYTDLYIYDWDLDRWTRAKIDLAVVYATVPMGVSATPPDLRLGGLFYSAGGGGYYSSVFNSVNPLAATLQTAEFGDPGGAVTRITEFHPIVDADDLGDVTVSIGARMRRSDAVQWGTGFSPSTNTGIARKRTRSRYHSVKVVIAAGTKWTHAQGVDINPVPAGDR